MTSRLVLLYVVYTLIAASSAYSQTLEKADYVFEIDGLKEGDECYIGYYHGDTQYVADTLLVSTDGEIIFSEENVQTGIYFFMLPDRNSFDFLVNEDRFTLATSVENTVANMEFVGTKENLIFYDYLKFLDLQRIERSRLDSLSSIMNGSNEAAGESLASGYQAIDNAVRDYQINLIENNEGLLVSKIIKAGLEPEIDEVPEGLSNEEIQRFRFYNYRKHFFDHFDFSGNVMLYTPLYIQKVRQYYQRLTVQHPDSVIKAVDFLINQSRQNYDLFRFTTVELLNHYGASNIMCMDKVLMHLIDTYYSTGEADWVNEAEQENLEEFSDRIRENLCGNQAVDFTAREFGGQNLRLYDIEAEWTILFFWEGTYSQRTDAAALKELEESIESDIEIVAIHFGERDDLVYILENEQIGLWNHVYQLSADKNLMRSYGIADYPTLYLLDKDKRIILKEVSIEVLKNYLSDKAN